MDVNDAFREQGAVFIKVRDANELKGNDLVGGCRVLMKDVLKEKDAVLSKYYRLEGDTKDPSVDCGEICLIVASFSEYFSSVSKRIIRVYRPRISSTSSSTFFLFRCGSCQPCFTKLPSIFQL